MTTHPSAQYSLTLRVEMDDRPGMLGKVASAIGDAGGTIGAIDIVQVGGAHTIRDITVETADAADWPRLGEAVSAVPGASVLDATDRTFMLHVGGKIELHNNSGSRFIGRRLPMPAGLALFPWVWACGPDLGEIAWR
jgi:malate dehydrogenase (oxaloacetate-decarboxylating)